MKTALFGVVSDSKTLQTLLARVHEAGFAKDSISVLYPNSTTIGGMGDALVGLGVPVDQVCLYTDHLKNGHIVVSVQCLPSEEVNRSRKIFEESILIAAYSYATEEIEYAGQIFANSGVQDISAGAGPEKGNRTVAST